jgi:hypothetical protein
LQLKEGLGRLGYTTDQNLLFCFRRLANGVSFSHLDDLARISVKSQRQVFGMFLNAVKNRVVLATLIGRRLYLSWRPYQMITQRWASLVV